MSSGAVPAASSQAVSRRRTTPSWLARAGKRTRIGSGCGAERSHARFVPRGLGSARHSVTSVAETTCPMNTVAVTAGRGRAPDTRGSDRRSATDADLGFECARVADRRRARRDRRGAPLEPAGAVASSIEQPVSSDHAWLHQRQPPPASSTTNITGAASAMVARASNDTGRSSPSPRQATTPGSEPGNARRTAQLASRRAAHRRGRELGAPRRPPRQRRARDSPRRLGCPPVTTRVRPRAASEPRSRRPDLPSRPPRSRPGRRDGRTAHCRGKELGSDEDEFETRT